MPGRRPPGKIESRSHELDLAGLDLILDDLAALTVGADGNLKGPKS